MTRLLFIVSTAAALVAAAPASAQNTYQGAQSGGVGVQVGPYGVGPMYGGPGSYGAYASPYSDPSWNSYRPGGYANGAGGGSWGTSSPRYTDYGSYGAPMYGDYGPTGYGSFAYGGAYPPGSAFAYGNECPTTRQRVVTRTGRVIYRTRADCN